MIYHASRVKTVTRRIGGLSAILQEDVRLAIWSRRLGREAGAELLDVAENLATGPDFMTLTDDPQDRIDQQLRRAKVHSAFLAHDIALLVTVYKELSKSQRIRVRLGGWIAPADGDDAMENLRLCCTYIGDGLRPGRAESLPSRARKSRHAINGQVAVFRRDFSGSVSDGLRDGSGQGLQLWLDRGR